jgi:hypothetical protein
VTFPIRAYGFNDPNLTIPLAIDYNNNVATFKVDTWLTGPQNEAEELAGVVRMSTSIERLTTVKVYAMVSDIERSECGSARTHSVVFYP